MTTLISSLNSLTPTTHPTTKAPVPTTIPSFDKVLQEKLKHEVNLTQVEATQVKAKALTNNLDNANKKIDEIYKSISKKREVLNCNEIINLITKIEVAVGNSIYENASNY